MARRRTDEEILDQMVYAVACVLRHYGPGYLAEGLKAVRESLKDHKTHCDTCFTVDFEEPADFHVVAKLDGYFDLVYEEVIQESKTGVDFEQV